MPTIPSKRKQIVGGGVGMKGIVSALAINPSGDGILAAGTFTRHVGLYSSNGSGELLGTFNVAKTDANRSIGGRGVTQLAWSPCGRYLYIAERKSDGVLVYDIRVTGQMLGYLRGRKAMTNQRMDIDVVSAGVDSAHEVWAGGTDGFMRVWRNPIYSAGGQDPDGEFKVHDGWSFCTLVRVSEVTNKMQMLLQAPCFILWVMWLQLALARDTGQRMIHPRKASQTRELARPITP